MNTQIKRLIEAVKYNLEKHENAEALRNYRELSEMKMLLSSNVYTQTQFHANTMDFIFKQKILAGFKEYSYVLAATFFGTMAFSGVSGNALILFLTMAAVFVYGAFRTLGENRTPNKVSDHLLKRMNKEKETHANVLYELDAIENFQSKIHDKIEPLFEQENSKKINDIKEQVRKDLKEKYPDLDLGD